MRAHVRLVGVVVIGHRFRAHTWTSQPVGRDMCDPTDFWGTMGWILVGDDQLT